MGRYKRLWTPSRSSQDRYWQRKMPQTDFFKLSGWIEQIKDERIILHRRRTLHVTSGQVLSRSVTQRKWKSPLSGHYTQKMATKWTQTGVSTSRGYWWPLLLAKKKPYGQTFGEAIWYCVFAVGKSVLRHEKTEKSTSIQPPACGRFVCHGSSIDFRVTCSLEVVWRAGLWTTGNNRDFHGWTHGFTCMYCLD